MKILNNDESKRIIGGGISLWTIFGIGSLVTFIGGLIDGIARPLRCH